ncbi:hypothetical protein [Rhodoferax fermentans]|nr:hypothetical protein [Rhodoferax fermentans]
MDFAKYVALLRSKALYFFRIDKFDDPFEGTISRAEYEDIVARAKKGEQDGRLPPEWRGKYFDVLMQNARNGRRSCYVNCWHFNEGESEAMWRLYSQSSFAIAIKSRYCKLRDALPTPSESGRPHVGPMLGRVTYLDHFKEQLPTGNLLVPLMNKRPSFQHEQECRALIWIPEPDDYVLHPDPDAIFAKYPVGLSIDVDLPSLVEFTAVSPLAPSWFLESVADVTVRYGFQWPTIASSLAAKPYI